MLSALVHPIFLALFGYVVATTNCSIPAAPTLRPRSLWLYRRRARSGYLTSATLGLLGLKRRGLLRHGWVLLLMPVHWLLLSVAAWRALWQLVRDPSVGKRPRMGSRAPPASRREPASR